MIVPRATVDLSLAVVKLPGSSACAAVCALSAVHLGLAVNNYACSTAPNRRFVDFVRQRLLKATLAQQTMPSETRQGGRGRRSQAWAELQPGQEKRMFRSRRPACTISMPPERTIHSSRWSRYSRLRAPER